MKLKPLLFVFLLLLALPAMATNYYVLGANPESLSVIDRESVAVNENAHGFDATLLVAPRHSKKVEGKTLSFILLTMTFDCRKPGLNQTHKSGVHSENGSLLMWIDTQETWETDVAGSTSFHAWSLVCGKQEWETAGDNIGEVDPLIIVGAYRKVAEREEARGTTP